MKYAKMANQSESDGSTQQSSETIIKHGILVHWALQPPMLQTLKPIEVLLTTIHSVFPPSFGVAGHDHFNKWTPVKSDDLQGAGSARVDDDKMKKIVRKLRFLLHPDKLPRDFNPDQAFMCKLLWDITSDAVEEHKKKEEDLGWIR